MFSFFGRKPFEKKVRHKVIRNKRNVGTLEDKIKELPTIEDKLKEWGYNNADTTPKN